MDSLLPDPIAGRDCGDCTVCCTVPAIDKPELQKVAMATCRHCDTDKGCTIYATRPEICRTYFCGWRRLDIFSDDWRPDLSGVYAELDGEDIPAQFDSAVGINLILVGNPLKAIREPRFIDFVSHGVANNIPLFLSLPGPRGKNCSRLILNTKEYFAASQHSRAAARTELELTLKRLRTAPDPGAHVMKNSGNDVSADA